MTQSLWFFGSSLADHTTTGGQYSSKAQIQTFLCDIDGMNAFFI